VDKPRKPKDSPIKVARDQLLKIPLAPKSVEKILEILETEGANEALAEHFKLLDGTARYPETEAQIQAIANDYFVAEDAYDQSDSDNDPDYGDPAPKPADVIRAGLKALDFLPTGQQAQLLASFEDESFAPSDYEAFLPGQKERIGNLHEKFSKAGKDCSMADNVSEGDDSEPLDEDDVYLLGFHWVVVRRRELTEAISIVAEATLYSKRNSYPYCLEMESAVVFSYEY